MPSLSDRRTDAWTALAAEPAVRAAERAIVTASPAILSDTLAVATAAEARRRLARVLELKERADRDPRARGVYLRESDELRAWAAAVYLAALREPRAESPPPRPSDTEESVSIRRSVVRPPFPGQRRRYPRAAHTQPTSEERSVR